MKVPFMHPGKVSSVGSVNNWTIPWIFHQQAPFCSTNQKTSFTSMTMFREKMHEKFKLHSNLPPLSTFSKFYPVHPFSCARCIKTFLQFPCLYFTNWHSLMHLMYFPFSYFTNWHSLMGIQLNPSTPVAGDPKFDANQAEIWRISVEVLK